MIYKNGEGMRDFLDLFIFIIVKSSIFFYILSIISYPTHAHGIIVKYTIEKSLDLRKQCKEILALLK